MHILEGEGILLSICIPTFNRCKLLDRLIKSITEQESFNNSIEIIISDNCSTDNTKRIVSKYLLSYNNIRYYRNDENIGMEKNIAKVLSLGNGKF